MRRYASVPSVVSAYFDAWPGATETQRRNVRYAFREAALIGIINAGATFLPIFLLRLGATNIQVGLFAAIPSLAGVLVAIPIGIAMARGRIVRWYTRGRIGSQAAFGAAAMVALVLPAPLVVPGILVVWAVAAVFSVITQVAFNIVMDATAGPLGRFELMSRRWSIIGLTGAVSLAGIGQMLNMFDFPLNYQLVFLGLSATGIWAYRFGSKIQVPDHSLTIRESGKSRRQCAAEMIRRVGRERPFVRFAARHFVWSLGTTFAIPLVPLYYVRVVGATDAWIGIVGTSQALMLLVGYAIWRTQSRRRGAQFVLACSAAGAAAYPAMLGLTNDLAVIFILASLTAIFAAGVNLAMFDRLMASISSDNKVTFAAIDLSLVHAAGIMGPIFGAIIADRVGLSGALFVASSIAAAGVALFALDAYGAQLPTPQGSRAP